MRQNLKVPESEGVTEWRGLGGGGEVFFFLRYSHITIQLPRGFKGVQYSVMREIKQLFKKIIGLEIKTRY